MSRKRYFIIGVLSMISLSALDLVITWILTPDLENEGNTFVSWFGMGWSEIILISIAFVVFVTIPFYYHCLVFTYPETKHKNGVRITRIANYFLRNNKNIYLSIGGALFNGLGFFLFWWFIINKIIAVGHNLLILTGTNIFETNFSERIRIMDMIETIFLTIMMVIFVVAIMYKNRNIAKRNRDPKPMHFSLIVLFFAMYISFRLFTSFARPVHSVALTGYVDPDIILVNIGEGDRASISNRLLAINNGKPALIAIDVFFLKEKELIQDSILIGALDTVKDDILIYGLDSINQPVKSIEKFRSLVSEEGLFRPETINGLISKFTPIRKIGNTIHEEFALKIVKHWKPAFKHTIKPDQSIPIKFTRTMSQFLRFDSIDFNHNNEEYLRNKIVLLGYLGPSDENKYFTPIRLVKEYRAGKLDTYGIVIVANEIRTILEYEKRE